MNFGSVSVGSTGSSILTISNAGTADLTISLLTLSGADFGISGITTPKTISAGQNAPVTLTFKPTLAGAASGSLTITSNDPTTPTAVVSLAGTGSSTAVGQLSANPASVNFGNVSTSSSASQLITLTNTGNAVRDYFEHCRERNRVQSDRCEHTGHGSGFANYELYGEILTDGRRECHGHRDGDQ